MTKRAIEQCDQPVVSRYLGDRVAGSQGARGQCRAVPGAGGLIGGGLEVRPGLFDLSGEQQATAEPHFQSAVHAVPPPGKHDHRPPPRRRVFPGQQAIRGLGSRPRGVGGYLIADTRPAQHGMVGQIRGLSPAGITKGGKDAGVQLRTPGRGELFLHRVPDKRMDESVGPRTRIVGHDQPGADRGIERREGTCRAGAEGGGQRRILEVAAQHRRHLERVPARGGERGQPLPDDFPDAAQRHAGLRPVGEQADALRDEQRVPAGAGMEVRRVDAFGARRPKPSRDTLLAQPGKLAPAAALPVRQRR